MELCSIVAEKLNKLKFYVVKEVDDNNDYYTNLKESSCFEVAMDAREKGLSNGLYLYSKTIEVWMPTGVCDLKTSVAWIEEYKKRAFMLLSKIDNFIQNCNDKITEFQNKIASTEEILHIKNKHVNEISSELEQIKNAFIKDLNLLKSRKRQMQQKYENLEIAISANNYAKNEIEAEISKQKQ